MADMNEKFKIIFFIVINPFYIQIKKINGLIFTLIFNLFS